MKFYHLIQLCIAGLSKLLTVLDDDRQYFWRVRPFNEHITCAPSRHRNFKTSATSGAKDVEVLSAVQIAPNPVVSDATARLYVNAAGNFEDSVSILDSRGSQLRSSVNMVFNAGETTFDLQTRGLANGLYFVVIENAESRTSRKMTILP